MRARGDRLHRVLLGAALALALGFVGVSVATRSAGVRVLPVLSGSMAPAVSADDLVVARPVAGERLAVGDVAVFADPADPDVPVMHRVVARDVAGGTVLLRTRGDANPVPDPWTLDAARTRLHRVTLVVPHAGRWYRVLHGSGRSAGVLVWPGVLAVLAAAAVAARLRRGGPAASGPGAAAAAAGAARVRPGGRHRRGPGRGVAAGPSRGGASRRSGSRRADRDAGSVHGHR